MLQDEIVFAAIRTTTTWRRLDERRENRLDYRVTDLRELEGQANVCVQQRDGTSARLILDLPSSGAPQYWLHGTPHDADDWVGQLLIWTDEEVYTLGLGSSRQRETRDGESYVVVANYGWQRSDVQEHARLTAAAGPQGWHGSDHS